MPKKITTSFTLEERHIALIAQVGKDNGNSSNSAALRFILDQYVHLSALEAQRAGSHPFPTLATAAAESG